MKNYLISKPLSFKRLIGDGLGKNIDGFHLVAKVTVYGHMLARTFVTNSDKAMSHATLVSFL